jgi:hypothetical protein
LRGTALNSSKACKIRRSRFDCTSKRGENMVVQGGFTGRMEPHRNPAGARACIAQLRQRCAVPLLVALASIGSAAPAQTGTTILSAEQARTAALFGIAQNNNVNGRLGTLRDKHTACDRFDVGANIRWERAPAADEEIPADVAGPRLTSALLRGGCGGEWAVWAGGDLDIGMLRPRSEQRDRDGVRTSGLTLGIDRKLRDLATVGGAIGYGRRSLLIDGADGSARAGSAMLYTVLEPLPVLDVSVLVGIGELGFDSRSAQQAKPESPFVDHGGSHLFGSLDLRAEMTGGDFRIAPYARYDVVRNQLDTYRASEEVLAFGLSGGIEFTVATVTVAPEARVEQRRVRSGVDCDGVPGEPSAVALPSYGSATASLTLPFRFGRATSIALEYAFASSTDAPRSEALWARLQAPF